MEKSCVELFILKSENVVEYVGFCKIAIKPSSKLLIIESIKTVDLKFEVSFSSQFIHKQNILFIIRGKRNDENIALVFREKSITKRIYDIIEKNRIDKNCSGNLERNIFDEKVLNPVLKTIEANKNDENVIRLKKLVSNFLELLNEDEKDDYLKLLKDKNVYNLIYPVTVIYEENCSCNKQIVSGEKSSTDIQKQYLRKRKKPCVNETSELDDSDYIDDELSNDSDYSDVDYPENDDDKPRPKQSSTTRTFKKQKLSLNIEENINEKDIVKKPDFELHEKKEFGKLKKLLILFNPDDRNLCRKYYFENKSQYFVCCGCSRKRKTSVARINKNEKTKGDYITFGKVGHFCEWEEYNIENEKFFNQKTIVKESDFKLIKELRNGIERETLVIFDTGNRDLCRKYYKTQTPTQIYYCCLECKKLGLHVNARIQKNFSEKKQQQQEFVILGKNEHICNLLPSKEENVKIQQQQNQNQIIEASEFEIIKNDHQGSPKLIVFHPTNKKLCYEFASFKKNEDYLCLGCREKHIRKNYPIVNVKLCKRENGENYLSIHGASEHHCNPRPYIPEKHKEKVIIKSPNFILYREKGNNKSLRFQIRDPSNNKKCYKYQQMTSYNTFVCSECFKKDRTCVRANICDDDENGKEYISLGHQKHVCSSFPYIDLKNNDSSVEILKSSGFAIKGRGHRPHAADKDRIIKSDGFELQTSRNGNIHGKLIIFHKENKDLCYEYCYEKNTKSYRCNKCRRESKLHVAAKIFHNQKDGSSYIVKTKNDHKCEPCPYVSEIPMVKAPNFKITEKDENGKALKFVVFPPPSNDAQKHCCYYFSYFAQEDSYRCKGCMRHSHIMNAKLVKDQINDEEIIKFSSKNHICEPEEFIQENKQIIKATHFALLHNLNGVPKSKLYILNSENNENSNYGYSYSKNYTVFYCSECKKQGKNIKAKICENKNNGKIYVEAYNQSEHICETKNFQAENKIIQSSNFSKTNDKNGNQIIKVKLPKKDKYLCYVFDFDKEMKVFCCRNCKLKKRYITANLHKNDKNEELLLINGCHGCSPSK